jgi:hypothetical protein
VLRRAKSRQKPIDVGYGFNRGTAFRLSAGPAFTAYGTKRQRLAAYTDFQWIADRRGIDNREAEFRTATSAVEPIASTLKTK